MDSKEKEILDKLVEERDKKSWYKKLWDSISLWWKFDGRYIITNTKLGFRNIWYWLPIIWKDRHWGHVYIYDILKHKLKAQAHRLHTANIYIGAQRDAEIIRTCVRLIDRVVDDWYSMEYMDYSKTKMRFKKVKDNPKLSEIKIDTLEENFDDYFKKYPLVYKKCLKGEGVMGKLKVKNGTFDPKNKENIAMDIAYTNQNRAHNLLFKIIKEHINSWWD